MKEGFLFFNLVDTDMLYGHRRDPSAMRAASPSTRPCRHHRRDARGDVLVLTADHGNDPTFPAAITRASTCRSSPGRRQRSAGADLGVREASAIWARRWPTSRRAVAARQELPAGGALMPDDEE